MKIMFTRWLLTGVLLLLAATSPTLAQGRLPGTPDSLRQLLARTPADTTRLYVLQELIFNREDNDPRVAAYLTQGVALARRLGHSRFEAFFLVEQGKNSKVFDGALATTCFQQALRVVERHGLYASSMATQAEIGLANVAGLRDDFVGAAGHCRQALRLAPRIAKPGSRLLLQGAALGALIETYTQRIEREGVQDSLRAPIRRYGRAMVEVARQLQAAGQQVPALGIRASYWQNSSDMYAAEGRLDSALVLGYRAAAAYEQLGSLKPFVTMRQHLINAEARAGHHARAVALARDTRALARSQGMALVEADCLSSLAVSLNALGQGSAAYQASARALIMRDSLLSAESREKVSELQVRFQTERQQTRIRELTQAQALAAARAAQERQRRLTWGVAGGAAVLLAGLYLWQRAAAARRQAELALRTRLAADLHDEVGALLARVTMRTELLQADNDLPQLQELLTESRSAASTVRDIIWSVNTSADTVGALVDRLRDLRDQTGRATPAPVTLALTPDPLDPARPLRPDVRQHTYLICKEAVTNALKHGQPGQPVRLALHLEASALHLTVNSVGTGGMAPRSSQGQRSMAYRAQLLGGTLHSAATAEGWQVALRVPRPLL